MKNKKKLLFLILPIIIIIIFIDQYNISHPKENAFSIYLVKNIDLSKEQKTPIRLEDLELEKEPFVEISDIESYYWNDTVVNTFPIESHSIKLNKELTFKNINDVRIPFVLFIDGNKYCLGTFHSPLSSMSPSTYADITISQFSYPNMVYHIRMSSKLKKDIRGDKSIYKILKKYHKLK